MKTADLNLSFSNGVIFNRPFAWMKIANAPAMTNNRAGFTSKYFAEATTDVNQIVAVDDSLKKIELKYHGSTISQNTAIRATNMIK